MNNLPTPFKIEKEKTHTEYPRPQMARKSYLNLNGNWEFENTPQKEKIPSSFSQRILVPFSPQSSLSKVGKKVGDFDYLYYQKRFCFPQGFNRGKILLHFGAVDMFCEVYFNGKIATSHVGGFHPFTVDITPYIEDFTAEQTLNLIVWDVTDSQDHTTGKQSLRRGGIWYTPQSGIWQTVWCESVNVNYIEDIKILPLFDDSAVEITVTPCGKLNNLTVTVFDGEEKIAEKSFSSNTVNIPIPEFIPWTPENPHLYDLIISCDTDQITSYFGMRKYSVEKDKKGKKRIMLNNKPYFMNGLLDQGYWSDGLLTAPSDEALRFDIEKAKSLGFNMLRKHIKIEPLRWYYYCDKLGMIVWQDAPSGGITSNNYFKMRLYLFVQRIKDNKYKFFGRKNSESKKEFLNEYRQMLSYLQNVVSIAVWVPFNEGWGQFDSISVAKLTKEIDPSRLVDHASGFQDQGGGDLRSVHTYFRKLYAVRDSRAHVISEYGGYTLSVDGHIFNEQKLFGYKSCKTKQELMNMLRNLFCNEVAPLIEKGLCASVYTQVSDVEDEINGLFTYDRAVCKVDEEEMREINSHLIYKE